MAFPKDWTIPEKIEWDEETFETLRYHGLGNAVTSPVAGWVARRVHSSRSSGAWDFDGASCCASHLR